MSKIKNLTQGELVNDLISKFILIKKKQLGLFHKEIAYAAEMNLRSYHSFIRREFVNGKPKGITVSTATRLLMAVASNWKEFGEWMHQEV